MCDLEVHSGFSSFKSSLASIFHVSSMQKASHSAKDTGPSLVFLVSVYSLEQMCNLPDWQGYLGTQGLQYLRHSPGLNR